MTVAIDRRTALDAAGALPVLHPGRAATSDNQTVTPTRATAATRAPGPLGKPDWQLERPRIDCVQMTIEEPKP